MGKTLQAIRRMFTATLDVTACEHGGDHEGENWTGTAF
jgi:hypothetical protein